jgi:hypothetical protein
MPVVPDKKEFLKTIASELHRPVRKKFRRSVVISGGIADIYAADLVDIPSFTDENDGYRYILNVVDVFSRYAFAVPLQTENADDVTEAFQKIFKDGGKTPHMLWVDRGGEFWNKPMKALCKKPKIRMYSTFSEFKVSVAESFNKTMKNIMWRSFTENHNHEWLDMLPKLVKTYNNKIHSALFGYTPKEAFNLNQKDETDLWDLQYAKAYKANVDASDKATKHKLGEWCRISRQKGVFSKGYERGWSTEIFKIVAINKTSPPRYHLQDWFGEPIEGSFYDHELQKTKIDPSIWLIDHVVKTRKVKGKQEELVRFLGMSANLIDGYLQRMLPTSRHLRNAVTSLT